MTLSVCCTWKWCDGTTLWSIAEGTFESSS